MYIGKVVNLIENIKKRKTKNVFCLDVKKILTVCKITQQHVAELREN